MGSGWLPRMRTKEHGASHPHGFRSTRDAPTAGLDVPCFDPHAAVKDREWAVDVAGSREDSHRITGRCQGGKRASSHARRGHSAAHSSHCGPRHHKAASQSPLTPGRGAPKGAPLQVAAHRAAGVLAVSTSVFSGSSSPGSPGRRRH